MDAHLERTEGPLEATPGLPGPVLGDPDEEEPQPAEEDVRPDPVGQPVVDRPDVHQVLEVPEDALRGSELLVAENDVLGGEAVARARHQELAVEAFFRVDLRLVDPEFAAGGLADVAAVGRVQSELAGRFPVRLPVKLLQLIQPPLGLGHGVLALCPVPRGLLGVPHDDEPPAGLAVSRARPQGGK